MNTEAQRHRGAGARDKVNMNINLCASVSLCSIVEYGKGWQGREFMKCS